MTPKPEISKYTDPRKFAADMIKWSEGDAGPGHDRGERTDADDRADATDDPAPAIANYPNPADYVKACKEHLARRLDGRAHTVPSPGHRDDAADRGPVRRTAWGEE